MVNVLCLDPSLAGTGWAILEVDETAPPLEHEGSPIHRSILLTGMIKTEPDKKLARKSEQNFRRAEFIAASLAGHIQAKHIKLIVMELPAGSQNAAAASCVALAVGVVAGLCGAFGLPFATVTPAELKNAVTGIRDASKEQVQDGVGRYFPQWATISADIRTKPAREAVADALGAWIACSGDPIVRAALI